jgi:hypothetical protein
MTNERLRRAIEGAIDEYERDLGLLRLVRDALDRTTARVQVRSRRPLVLEVEGERVQLDRDTHLPISADGN